MTNPVNPKPSSRTHAAVSFTTAADGISEEVNISGLVVCSVQMSTDWTAAKLGFQASIDGINFHPVRDADGNYLHTITSANRIVVFDPTEFAGLERLKLTSQTSNGTQIAQAAPRTLILALAKGRMK